MDFNITNKKDNDISLSLLSEYRNLFFAVAILLIMFHHTGNTYPSVVKPLFIFLRDTAAVGVDIFMFMSGMGCYYSMEKHKSVSVFYKNRLLRIMPSYMLVMIPFLAYICANEGVGIAHFFYDISLVGFWIEGKCECWFVTAILFLYLIYPLIHLAADNWKEKTGIAVMLFAYILVFTLLYYVNNDIFYNIERLFARIPLFLLGCFMAKYIRGGVMIKRKLLLHICLIVFAVTICLIYLVYNKSDNFVGFLKRLLYEPLAISITGILTCILSSKSKIFHCKFITIIASMTLELYLVHERIISLFGERFENIIFFNDKYGILLELIYAVISLIAAYLVMKITSSFRFVLNRRKT